MRIFIPASCKTPGPKVDGKQKKDPAEAGSFINLNQKPKGLLAGFFFDVFDHIANGLKFLGVLIGNFH